MMNLMTIVWSFDPVMFSIGSFDVRYYSLMWALAIGIGLWMFTNFVKREGLPPKVVDKIFYAGFFGTVLGARLGHCLFYDFSYYITHPIQILNIREGGLASHGAAIGLLIGLWIFSKKTKLPYIWSLDRVMLPVAVGGALVRFGNLFNSEIYGVETSLPWGFVFTRAGETMPKHPTQIYEALCYLVTFAVLMVLYYKKDAGRRRPGVMFGVGLIGVFLSRFVIEYVKNPQEAFEESMSLLMGQWLSVPFIVLGVWMIVKAYRGKQPAGGESKGKEAALNNIKSVKK